MILLNSTTKANNIKKNKTNMVTINKNKTGPRHGLKNNSEKTLADWYQVCDDYYNLGTMMSKAKFLKSDRTADKFLGTQSEQQTFRTIYQRYLQTRFRETKHRKDRIKSANSGSSIISKLSEKAKDYTSPFEPVKLFRSRIQYY